MKILNTDSFINEKLTITPISKTRLSDIKENTIVATNDTIKDIVKDAISKYGNEADLNFIQTYRVTNMAKLFLHSNFNGDISKWDVGNVTSMECMFYDSAFNGDISKWDVGNVVNMAYMFQESKFNGNISNWNVSNVVNMRCMFCNTNFNGDISKWNVGNVKYMDYMFQNNTKFNQNISKWDVSNVYNMGYMFASALEFNQDISEWKPTNCEHMEEMFYNAKSFDQDLSKWIVVNANIKNMFKDCPMSAEPEKHPIDYDVCMKYIIDYYEENIDDSETEGRADTYEELMKMIRSEYDLVYEIYDYEDTEIYKSKKDGTYCIIHTREDEDNDTVYYEVLDITPVEQYAKYL